MDNEKLQVIPVHVLVFARGVFFWLLFWTSKKVVKEEPGDIFVWTNPINWKKKNESVLNPLA
jgi:hypothetical protein